MTIREYIRRNPKPEGMSNKDYFLKVADAMDVHYSSVEKPFFSERKLERTKYTQNAEGKIITETFTAVPQDKESTGGMIPVKITTNPYGGQWVRYEVPEVDLNDVIEQIRQEVTKSVTPYNPPKQKGKGCYMNVYSSDKHFGAHTKENSVYKNDYCPKVFRKRHDKLIDRIYKEYKRFGVFNMLTYFDLGDAADGWNGKTTRAGHGLPQNLDNVGQWREYVAEHKRAFDKIMDMNPAQNYSFIGAANSNHGGDFDFILMKTLAMFLEVKYPTIKTHVSNKPFDFIQVGSHAFIYGHGKDDEDMRNGFPLHLNDKTENWINDFINQKGLKGSIHFVAGDLHQSSQGYGKRFRYRRVLSMYGSSKWIHTNFGSGRPGVSYDVIEGDSVYTCDLFL